MSDCSRIQRRRLAQALLGWLAREALPLRIMPMSAGWRK